MPDRADSDPHARRALNLPFSGRGWKPRRLLPVTGRICQATDLIILGAAFLGIVLLPLLERHAASFSAFLQLTISLRVVLVAVLCVSTWRMILLSVGMYSPQRTRSATDYVLRCIIGLNSCTLVVGLIELVLHAPVNIWHIVQLFWFACLLAMTATRASLLLWDAKVRPRLRPHRNLIIVGSGQRAAQVFAELEAHAEWEYRLLGFVDSEPQGGFVPAHMILGGIDDLEQILMHTIVDEVVIALPMKSQYEAVGYSIAICQMLGIQSQYFTDYFGTAVTKRRTSAGPQSGRVVLEVVHDDYRLQIKRVVDVLVSAALIAVLAPVYLGMAVAVRLTSPGPILFRQERFGLHKRTFFMLKFRSMIVDAESRQAAIEHLNETTGPAFKIKNDPRVTSIGNFIRRTSLDELPQLFNVFRGDMSLVGPRPLPLRDVNKFSEAWLMRRFSVKPGVTCLWQIMGRSNTDFDRWIQLDLEYINNWSLSLDLLILAKTLPAVLLSRGAS